MYKNLWKDNSNKKRQQKRKYVIIKSLFYNYCHKKFWFDLNIQKMKILNNLIILLKDDIKNTLSPASL